MASQGGGVVRWVIACVILLTVGIGFYTYRQKQSSDRIKTEMLAIFDDMQLSSDWRGEVARLFPAAHKQAYANAMDIRKQLGRKFNAKEYYDEVFDLIVRWAREDGRERLAERLETDRKSFALRVTER